MTKPLDIEKTIAQLPLPARIGLLTGRGWWHTEPFGDIPSVRMSDGPNGVRGTRFFNSVPSSCFPASTGLGSSFDVDLATKVGLALGDECHAKSVHMLLGPTVNTQRSPLGGRGFESFSEDPHLNGSIAAAYINGLQEKGVAACIKHFIANDQEYQRMSVSSEVSERALREIYLKPFQIAIKHSSPWCLMTSYNRLNGLHCSEDKWLLDDILRKEWGWKGMISSDWTGTYSTTKAIKAGLDLEMPGPSVVRGVGIVRALIAEKLFVSDLDERLRNILSLVNHAKASGIPFDGPEESLDTPQVRALLRTAAADATVLLKNDKGLLPLSGDIHKIAVIGPNASTAVISGGGSASLRPTYAVSPVEGITEAAKSIGAEVSYTVGAQTHQFLPLVDPFITSNHGDAAFVEFWNETPTDDWLSTSPNFHLKTPKSAFSTPTYSGFCFLADGVDDSKVNETCWIRYTTTFTPNESGDWEFGLSVAGRANLFINQELVVDLSTDPKQGSSFFGLGTVESRGLVSNLRAGQKLNVEIRLANADFIARGVPFFCRGGVRFGSERHIDPEQGIKDAVKLAKESDVAILVVGLNNDWESEGHDRVDMTLPGLTNRLVSEVLKANSKTIVVNQSGTPVEMPWISEAHTLLQAFYGGNEVGHGMADVLFGKVNPSGKLPLTFPKRLEDSPSFSSFSHRAQAHGKVLYNEGIFVGYRGFEIKDIAPLFPFGHGLSYTQFHYSDISASSVTHAGDFSVTFTLKNTGNVPGREVAQVYVADQESSLPRAKKELHGFKKVQLAPGESTKVTVEMDKYALSFFDERQGKWTAEAGKFTVSVGASSEDIKLAVEVELEKTFTWLGL